MLALAHSILFHGDSLEPHEAVGEVLATKRAHESVDIDVTSTSNVADMELSIQEIAKLAGTTSRTLRHYDEIGLVPPSRIGRNGYRYYDDRALVRLQRVLLLRELGLGLPQIGDVLAHESDEASALTTHLGLLRQEQDRLARQIAAVEHTIHALKGGEELMSENMFDGFDHTQYKDEVEQRWGKDAYTRSNDWWNSMSDAERTEWQQRLTQLNGDWVAAAESGIAPDTAEALALVERHVEWLRSIPGTPAMAPGGDLEAYARGLGEMYVADERFAANYGGVSGATFVRDAINAYFDAK